MSTPATEAELLQRATALAGLSLAELARRLGSPLPRRQGPHKGLIGELVESALGCTAGSDTGPDFPVLGIELKTLPLDPDGRPRESTYVCVVPLNAAPGTGWRESPVWAKLARVLWIPVITEGGEQPLPERRIGMPLLWSPTAEEEEGLREDWEELMTLVSLGRLDQIHAGLGRWLQIRPKAADASALTGATDATGAAIRTLPRGFYLRTAFTRRIVERCYA